MFATQLRPNLRWLTLLAVDALALMIAGSASANPNQQMAMTATPVSIQLPSGLTLDSMLPVLFDGQHAAREIRPTLDECKGMGALPDSGPHCWQQVKVWIAMPGHVVAQFCHGGLYPVTDLLTPEQLANPVDAYQHKIKIEWTSASGQPPVTSCPS